LIYLCFLFHFSSLCKPNVTLGGGRSILLSYRGFKGNQRLTIFVYDADEVHSHYVPTKNSFHVVE
jgi:hypothetical protein